MDFFLLRFLMNELFQTLNKQKETFQKYLKSKLYNKCRKECDKNRNSTLGTVWFRQLAFRKILSTYIHTQEFVTSENSVWEMKCVVLFTIKCFKFFLKITNLNLYTSNLISSACRRPFLFFISSF